MTLSKIDIRLAVDADIPALCELLSLLFAQESEFHPQAQLQAKGLTMIIGHPEVGAILVATLDAQVVGMLNLLWTVSTALGQRVGLLEDVVVLPEARNKGVGATLLQAGLSLAHQHDVGRITLLTDPSNHAAHAFYARHGFVASAMQPWRHTMGHVRMAD